MIKKIAKVFILITIILALFCGCSSEVEKTLPVKTEHEITHVKYTAKVGGLFDQLEEVIELTYVSSDNKYITAKYSVAKVIIGNENKIVYVDEGNFWTCYCDYIMLTQKVYDTMIESTPKVISVKDEIELK